MSVPSAICQPCGFSKNAEGTGDPCCPQNVCKSDASCIISETDPNHNYCIQTNGHVNQYCMNTGGGEGKCDGKFEAVTCNTEKSKCLCDSSSHGKACKQDQDKYFVCIDKSRFAEDLAASEASEASEASGTPGTSGTSTSGASTSGLKVYQGKLLTKKEKSARTIEQRDNNVAACAKVNLSSPGCLSALTQQDGRDYMCVNNDGQCLIPKDTSASGTLGICGPDSVMCKMK